MATLLATSLLAQSPSLPRVRVTTLWGRCPSGMTGPCDAVIFVHGIWGSEKTWTNSSTHASWPALLRDDRSYDGDIYSVEYETEGFRLPLQTFLAFFTGGQESSPNNPALLGEAFLKAIEPVLAGHRHVFFVCHSMGGNVVRDFLVRITKHPD